MAISMRTVAVGNHVITVEPFGLRAKVRYDGRLVAQPAGLLRAEGVFNVEEDGEQVQYEVVVKSTLFSLKMSLRRNGKIIYSE